MATPVDCGCSDPFASVSTHYFGDSDDEDGFAVRIFEVMDEEYGLFVWPCAIALAEYVWQNRSRFSNATVLELGAGTSLPGLVAAKLGSKVILSDHAGKTEVLTNMKRACYLNDVNCEVLPLCWGEWNEQIFNLEPTILLGADVLYNSADFDDLFATVAFLLTKIHKSTFITTYHNRSGHHKVQYLMMKWGLACIKLLDAYSFMPSQKVSSLQGCIQLAEIALNQ